MDSNSQGKTPAPPSEFQFSNTSNTIGQMPKVLPSQDESFFVKNKLFLIAGTGIALLALLGGGIYVAQKQKTVPAIAQTTPIPTNATIVANIAAVTRASTPQPNVLSTDPNTGWKNYLFGVLGLTIEYPPDWFVQVSSTSDGKSFHIFNTRPLSLSPYNTAKDQSSYAIYIGSYKAAITTLSQLQTELAKDYGATTYYYGSPAGSMVISNERIATYSSYTTFARDVSYTGLPGITIPQVYFLDGRGLTVKTQLELDTKHGKPFYDQILGTLKFTP